MAAMVGWPNEQLWRTNAKVVAEGKGSQGDGKAQRQPREEAAERELAVQVAGKDIKGEEWKGRRLSLNPPETEGVGCRRGM